MRHCGIVVRSMVQHPSRACCSCLNTHVVLSSASLHLYNYSVFCSCRHLRDGRGSLPDSLLLACQARHGHGS